MCHRPSRPMRFALLGLLALLLSSSACAGRAWKQALLEDSAVGYHRFLREYPESEHVAWARERIDFLEVARSPTLEAFELFEARHPDSTFLKSLRSRREALEFEAALRLGAAHAYEAFLESFPNGDYAARARGNASYLRDVAGRMDAGALARFAAAYPESDFAPEAMRTASAVARRRDHQIATVGLRVEVAPGVPESRRIEQAFVEQAIRTFSFAPVRLIRLEPQVGEEAPAFDALLSVRHREQAVDNVKVEGTLAQPGVLATTDVELVASGESIFQRVFELPVESRAYVEGTSVLFGEAGPRFWDAFFLPVASWEVQRAVRAPFELTGDAVAVDASVDRAVVLFRNGSFAVFQLAEPSEPIEVGRVGRQSRFERFDGVRILSEGVAVFGEDGLQVFPAGSASREPAWKLDRGQIGSVRALEPVVGGFLVGGAKGLLRISRDGRRDVERWMRPAVRGLARLGDSLVVADADTLHVVELGSGALGRVIGRLPVGKSFATHRVRVFGSTGFVIGAGGVLVVDLRDVRAPRILARLRPERVGEVEDVGRVGSRVFLVGERGTQMLGATLDRVVEVVDSIPGQAAVALGRHLVTVGDRQLQVLDGLPFGPARASSTLPAAYAR